MCRAVESSQDWILAGYCGVDVLENPRIPRGGFPAIVAKRNAGLEAASASRIQLEEQVRAGELAVEVLSEAGGARVERRAHVLPFRIADAAEPSVLKGGKERDEAEQRHRNGEHRQATAPSHLASLACRFRANEVP